MSSGKMRKDPKRWHYPERWHWKMDYCKKKNLSPALSWLWDEADRKYEEQLKEQGNESNK